MKNKMPKMPKMVYMIWEDAWHSDESYSTEEVKGEGQFLVKAAGFLVYEDSKHIYLASSKNQNKEKHWRNVQSIPKSLIRHRRYVK